MSNNDSIIFVHQLPLKDLKKICSLLDETRKWEELAKELEYDFGTIIHLRQKEHNRMSGTEELLEIASENHLLTVNKLYVHLIDMHQNEAADVIKQFVTIPVRNNNLNETDKDSSLKVYTPKNIL